jgi:hypothetical protein
MISEEAEKETFSCSQRVLETNRKRDFISSSPLFLRVCQKEIQNIYSKEADMDRSYVFYKPTDRDPEMSTKEAEEETFIGFLCFWKRAEKET